MPPGSEGRARAGRSRRGSGLPGTEEEAGGPSPLPGRVNLSGKRSRVRVGAGVSVETRARRESVRRRARHGAALCGAETGSGPPPERDRARDSASTGLWRPRGLGRDRLGGVSVTVRPFYGAETGSRPPPEQSRPRGREGIGWEARRSRCGPLRGRDRIPAASGVSVEPRAQKGSVGWRTRHGAVSSAGPRPDPGRRFSVNGLGVSGRPPALELSLETRIRFPRGGELGLPPRTEGNFPARRAA